MIPEEVLGLADQIEKDAGGKIGEGGLSWQVL